MITCKLHDIEIERGLLANPKKIADYLATLGSKIAIMTDETISKLYGESFSRSLKTLGLDSYLFSFPAGEQYKTRQTKEQLENQLFEKGLGRDSCIVALGGGVVTDLVGFIAATYCRGIPLVNIPTTLLGMVDACIGGKTGIDVPYGKNLVGSIYQPKKVFIDPDVLSKLPVKELRNGVVEMIKHGLVADLDYFTYLEQHVDGVLALDPAVIDRAIADSCRIKSEIVEKDEKENGIRRLINCGHTVGHALEKLSSYSLPHGEAVAIGIVVEGYMSMLLGHLDSDSLNRIKNLLIRYGLPFRLPAIYSPQVIMDAMTLDKKSVQGKPRFVVLEKIGVPLSFNGSYCTCIDESVISKALNRMSHDLCSH